MSQKDGNEKGAEVKKETKKESTQILSPFSSLLFLSSRENERKEAPFFILIPCFLNKHTRAHMHSEK